jgi:hypothetical protein
MRNVSLEVCALLLFVACKRAKNAPLMSRGVCSWAVRHYSRA